MDKTTQKPTIRVARQTMDARDEYLLGSDFVLPEYCPDAAVVLKCTIMPHVQSRRISGDRLQLDGTAAVRIWYLDEERRCVREAEFAQPLSCTLSIGAGSEDVDPAAIRVTMTPAYVNCRATSPRRMEVRASFSVRATAVADTQVALFSPEEGSGLFTRTAEHTLPTVCAVGEKPITVSEVIDLDSEQPSIEQLLGGEVTAAVTECRLLSGRAIVKGQVFVHVLYTDDTENGTTDAVERALPFGQILDLPGVQDDMLCLPAVSVVSDTERCVANAAGQNAAIEIEAHLLLQITVCAQQTVPLVLDAFHPGYPVTLERQKLELTAPVGCRRVETAVQLSVPLPAEDLQELIDVWAWPDGSAAQDSEGAAGHLQIGMLVRDGEGAVAYFERPEQFALPQSEGTQGTEERLAFTVTGVEYTATADRLDMKVGIDGAVTSFARVQETPVADVQVHEDRPFPKQTASIRLYYAQPGERLWDIACACRTSPEQIAGENRPELDETGAFAKRTVLIVPTV